MVKSQCLINECTTRELYCLKYSLKSVTRRVVRWVHTYPERMPNFRG